ncbi:MAG: hypothetical protein AB1938_26960 [Myxococcota bacterium]
MPGPIGNRPVSPPVATTGPASPRASSATEFAAFTPKGTQPSTWSKKAIEFSGTVNGRDVSVSLTPPGTAFWKGDRGVVLNGVLANYQEAHDLADSLRKAGWGATADLIAKQPSPGALFVNFSQAEMTQQNSIHGTLQKDAFTFIGKLTPQSEAKVRYEPTADGKGKVFMSVTGGSLAAAERELDDSERYQLSERIIHGGDNGRARQAADFISPAAVKDWERRVPGGPGLDSAGPPRPTLNDSVVKPATSWFQDLINRLTR